MLREEKASWLAKQVVEFVVRQAHDDELNFAEVFAALGMASSLLEYSLVSEGAIHLPKDARETVRFEE